MDFKPLDAFLDSLLDRGYPMYDTTIHIAGQEVYRRRGGYIDVEKQRRHEDGTLYLAYSCSKPVTCAAAMTLFAQGKFLLDDPVRKYIPEFGELTVAERGADGAVVLRPAKTVMTIRHLFTMTSGLNYNLGSASIRALLERDPHAGTLDVVRAIAKEPLSFDPGARWQYGLSHDVLAAVVEVISGKPFGDYVKETIFDPLGMKDSDFRSFRAVLDPAKAPRLAQQYRFNADHSAREIVGIHIGYALSDRYESGGAGLVTSAEDYIRFADMMANGGVGANGVRILPTSAIDLMRMNQLSETQKHSFNWKQYLGYGYGLGVRTLVDRSPGGSLSSIGEFGWAGAAGAITLFDPAKKIALYHAQHILNPWEEVVFPPLRNLVYACLEN